MGITLVAALLLVELMLLPTRSMITHFFGENRPLMKLPVASNPNRCCRCFFGEELSWTKSGGWVSYAGKIEESEIESLLRNRVENGRGRSVTLRLRIPADADAKHFMKAAMSAQTAGVSCLHVAVVR